jgi:hypothetical protein
LPIEIVTNFPFAWQAWISAARNWQLAKLVPGKALPGPHIWAKFEKIV